MNDVLLQVVCPHRNSEAVVETDGSSIHFYLFATDGEVRSCWVRNLTPAPIELDVTAMRDGAAPMLPRQHCKHPDGAKLPAVASLRIVWFEEGNGAALLEQDEILAVLPAWSGKNGFNGYARDCLSESPLCWPMPVVDTLKRRIDRADEYWKAWDDDTYWTNYRDQQIAAYEAAFSSKHAKYYSIDGGAWPPKAMLRFDLDSGWILVTCCVSIRPQPGVELSTDDPAPLRRIELGAAFDRDCPESEVLRFASYLSGQTEFPWSQMSWFGHGHTLPCDSTPDSIGGSDFPAVLFVPANTASIPVLLPEFRGDPVNLHWMIPITESEREYAESKGSTALLELLSPTLPARRRNPAI